MALRTFELSYAGVPLSIVGQTLDNILSEAKSGLHNLADTHLRPGNWNPVAPLDPPAWPGANKTRLPYPFRFPTYPEMMPGQYFYPTGASRWSVGYFLVTESEKDDILEVVYPSQTSQPSAQPFVMRADDVTHPDNKGGVKTNLFMLPPRPVGQSAGEGLYLLTLVDERYYFWNKDSGAIHSASLTDWPTLLNALAAAAGISLSVTTAISADYQTPEPDSDLYTNHEAVPVLLDAAAWNVGCVVVRNLDGTYVLQRYAEAAKTINANRPPYPRYRALGGNILDPTEAHQVNGVQPGVVVRHLNSIIPSSVTVTFPKFSCVLTPPCPSSSSSSGSSFGSASSSSSSSSPCSNCCPTQYIEPDGRVGFFVRDSYGDVWVEQTLLSSLSQPYAGYTGFNGTKLLHDTAKALYNNIDGHGTPINEATLHTLALKLTKDFYDSLLYGLDEWYAGIRKWTPECIDDVLWTLGSGPTTTRIARLPWNFGVDQMEHHVPDCNHQPSSASSSSSSSSSSSTSSSSISSSSISSSSSTSVSSSSSSSTSSSSTSSGSFANACCSWCPFNTAPATLVARITSSNCNCVNNITVTLNLITQVCDPPQLNNGIVWSGSAPTNGPCYDGSNVIHVELDCFAQVDGSSQWRVLIFCTPHTPPPAGAADNNPTVSCPPNFQITARINDSGSGACCNPGDLVVTITLS